MAVDASKVTVATYGEFWIATANTAYPTDPTNPAASGYSNIGHTSPDNPFVVKRSGGDITVLASWQSSSLRSSTAPITYSITMTALQADENVLNFYYGGGSKDGTTKRWKVPAAAAAQPTTLFVTIKDATNSNLAKHWYFANAVGLGADDTSSATDAFMTYPLEFSILSEVSDLTTLFEIDAGLS
jgi:hypothetical protein